MKKLVILLALAVGVLSVFSISQPVANADSYAPNCYSSAVIKCGVYDQTQMNTRLAAQPSAGALYSKLGGIGTDLSKSKQGIVYPDGTVTVNGKTVATGAMTFGRVKRATSDTPISVSTGGVTTTFWKHSITGAAIYKPVEAYVFMNSYGEFTGAIIRMCGNPVVAKPVEQPKPEPKPEAIVCTDLRIDEKDEKTRTVTVTVTGTTQNTTIDDYRIDFGDNTVKNTQTAEHTYAQAGEYTITAYVSGKVYDKVELVTSGDCKKTITFEEEKEQVLQCTLLKLDEYDKEKRYVKATVTGFADNTTITGYRIDFGDGDDSVFDEQTADYTYPKDGKYTITGYVLGTLDGENVTVSGVDCVEEVEVAKPEVLPEVTPEPEVPEVMPETGAAGAVALFGGVSALGAVGHRLFTARRFKK